MTGNRSTTQKELDTFFRKITAEAEKLPVRITAIPTTNNELAGLCLLAEGRQPTDIEALVATITADPDGGIQRNKYKEPAPCQVTVEEKSHLFNLFSRNKDHQP